MASHGSLAYREVQAAMDGAPDARLAPLTQPVIRPLYAAYEALKSAPGAAPAARPRPA